MTQREMIRYNRVLKVRKMKMVIMGILLLLFAVVIPFVLDYDITFSVFLLMFVPSLLFGKPEKYTIEDY